MCENKNKFKENKFANEVNVEASGNQYIGKRKELNPGDLAKAKNSSFTWLKGSVCEYVKEKEKRYE